MKIFYRYHTVFLMIWEGDRDRCVHKRPHKNKPSSLIILVRTRRSQPCFQVTRNTVQKNLTVLLKTNASKKTFEFILSKRGGNFVFFFISFLKSSTGIKIRIFRLVKYCKSFCEIFGQQNIKTYLNFFGLFVCCFLSK